MGGPNKKKITPLIHKIYRVKFFLTKSWVMTTADDHGYNGNYLNSINSIMDLTDSKKSFWVTGFLL